MIESSRTLCSIGTNGLRLPFESFLVREASRFDVNCAQTLPDAVKIPLATTSSPAMLLVPNWLLFVSSTAAATLISPAPAPMSPAEGMNVLVNCRAARVSVGASVERASSKSAAAPLTTPAAMLVPESCMYALAPLPATWRSG